jgi:hypothetical protein
MMMPGMNPTSTANMMRKTIVARENFDGSHMWHNGRTSCRMFKKAVQQGHSEQSGEAYASVG